MADYAPPLDYSSPFANVPSPGQSFLQGVQGGLAVQQAQMQQAQQAYSIQRSRQMQQAAMAVAQNPTPENIAQLSIAFPEMSEQFKRSYDMYQPQQQRAVLQAMTLAHAAALNGRPDIAADQMDSYAAALQNSGAPDLQIQTARGMAKLARENPNQFTTASGMFVAAGVGPDKYGQTFKDQVEGDTNQAKQPFEVQRTAADASKATTQANMEPQVLGANVAKTNADITNMAGRLALDRDALTTQTQLKLKELGLQYGTPAPEAAKLINDSAMSAAAGEQSASRLNDLADRMEQADRTQGLAGNAYEAMKRATGGGDGQTALKQEYARIVNNSALSSIKDALGGRVTDVDMKVAMGTVPDANASTQTVTSYLRGVAKLQLLDAARQQAQAEWLSQAGHNAHLGPAKQDMSVMGTQVPAGTTFADFSRQFLQQKAEQIGAQGALARAQGRSYLRFATPGGEQPAQATPAAPVGAPQPAPVPAAPAPAAAPVQQSEMDGITQQLATLEPQRAALKSQLSEIERDYNQATSLSGRQHVPAAVVQQISAQRSSVASQLAAIEAQIGQLNAQGRTASMTPAGTAPAKFQAINDKYKPATTAGQ